MAFSIQTNINSLIAQENLRVNSDFQSRTINRLTSGFRINQSGDDAAGLAIANKYRSDVAELTQGVRNANDGISTLQIVDGGMNNISKMLDRLKTLATQSATGTLADSSRAVLNNEFQTLLGEIDRQAQAIGLNTGGQFAKSLSVYIGGGKSNTGEVDINNGSVTLNLATAMVDTNSLGLKGYQAVGGTTDISTGSSTQSVAAIVGDTGNTTAVSGFTDFYFSGPGFADGEKVKVTVNLQNVSDTSSLVDAINSAISAAGTGGSQAASKFKEAGIVASVHTDASGGQQIAFTSSTTAFQVQAGDKMANALMGNFSAPGSSTGAAITSAVTGYAVSAVTTTAVANPTGITVRLAGGGLSSPVDITLQGTSTTIDLAIADIQSQVAANADLQAAGITMSATTPGAALAFTSARGEQFSVQVTGDASNRLGFGSFLAGDSGEFDYTSRTGAAFAAPGGAATSTLEFSLNGAASDGNSITLTLSAASTIAGVIDDLNAAFSADAQMQAAGLKASNSGGAIKIESTNGTEFRMNVAGSTTSIGFGTGGVAAFTGQTVAASAMATVDAGGASNSTALNFTAVAYGNDDQTITISANDSSGEMHAKTITLQNDATARTGRTIDEAIGAINDALQQSNDATLKSIVAVKEVSGGAEKINLLSSLTSFKVSLGSTANSTGVSDGGTMGTTVSSEALAGGANIDISTQAGAKTAVTALATAVSTLGDSQAAVGKAQNQLSYALGLAQSQISNYSAAESRIRDADIAAEAANLTKAQVLQQASLAAMAQANSAPQAVLALLRG